MIPNKYRDCTDGVLRELFREESLKISLLHFNNTVLREQAEVQASFIKAEMIRRGIWTEGIKVSRLPDRPPLPRGKRKVTSFVMEHGKIIGKQKIWED